MRRLIPILLVVGILGAFIWTLVFLHRKSQSKPVEYEVRSPERSDIIKKTVATGAIVPRKEVAIKSRVAGIIERLHVEPGAQVEADRMIARIKIVPDVLALSRAENAVDTARIALEDAEREIWALRRARQCRRCPESSRNLGWALYLDGRQSFREGELVIAAQRLGEAAELADSTEIFVVKADSLLELIDDFQSAAHRYR